MQYLISSLAFCVALASGCALFGNKSSATPAAGDPTCVADGSFDADFYGCTGKVGSNAAPSTPPPAEADQACLQTCGSNYGTCTNNCMQNAPDSREGCMSPCEMEFNNCRETCG